MMPSPPPLGSTFTMMEGRKDLDTSQYGYKLAGSSYGLDTAYGEFDIDEKRMALRFPFADGNRRDGVGDLLEVGGIRTDRHEKNRIVLFDHGKQVQLPIGKAEDPNTGAYTVEIDPVGRKAWLTCFFYQGKGLPGAKPHDEYDHALFCEQLFDLAAKRYIRAGSIGYQVVKALKLPADYEQGTPPGLHLLVTLMLEGSLVVLPANGDTVRKALALPQVCGKALSPVLVKSLSPYAEPTKVMANGIGTKASQFSRGNFSVGQKVVWNSRTGPVVAEFRGQLMGLDGYEATIIVREEGSSPFQVTVPIMEIKQKNLSPQSKALEQIYRGCKIEKIEAQQVGYTSNRSTLNKVGIDTSRKFSGYEITLPDGGSKVVDKLSEAKRYIDNYLGPDEKSLEGGLADTTPTSSFSQENGKMESGAASKNIKSIRAKYKRKGFDDPESFSQEAWRRGDKTEKPHVRTIRTNRMQNLIDATDRYTLGDVDRGTFDSGNRYQISKQSFGYMIWDSQARESKNCEIKSLRKGLEGGESYSKAFNVGDMVENTYAGSGAPAWQPGKVVEVAKQRKQSSRDQFGNRESHQPETRYRVNFNGRDYWVDEGALELAGTKSLSSIRRKYMAKAIPVAADVAKRILQRLSPGEAKTISGISVRRTKPGLDSRFNQEDGFVIDGNQMGLERASEKIAELTGGKSLETSKSLNYKSLNVRYRSKVIKGFAEVQVKFALPDRDRTKQAAMFAEMEANGYGRPQGVRWSEDGKDLASTAENVSYKFCLEPGKSLPAELEKLSTIAAKHGARLVGNTKS